MEKGTFLGTGVKFPLQVDKTTGRFMMSTEEENVKESIYIILMTQKTERWIRPEFGSLIMSYTFMDTSLTRINMMARELRQTIMEQEPRVTEVDVKIEPRQDRGCLLVNISYTIAKVNTRDNLVFPFYLYSEAEGRMDGKQEQA